MARDKRATYISLREGKGDGVIVPVEPRPKTVYYEGQLYFRMDAVTTHDPKRGIGQCYLWEGYWRERLAARAEKDDSEL